MLVEHQGVKSHLFGVNFLVQVTVVEMRADAGIVVLVTDTKVGGLSSHQAGTIVLPGLFRKMANEHINTSREGSVRAGGLRAV